MGELDCYHDGLQVHDTIADNEHPLIQLDTADHLHCLTIISPQEALEAELGADRFYVIRGITGDGKEGMSVVALSMVHLLLFAIIITVDVDHPQVFFPLGQPYHLTPTQVIVVIIPHECLFMEMMRGFGRGRDVLDMALIDNPPDPTGVELVHKKDLPSPLKEDMVLTLRRVR